MINHKLSQGLASPFGTVAGCLVRARTPTLLLLRLFSSGAACLFLLYLHLSLFKIYFRILPLPCMCACVCSRLMCAMGQLLKVGSPLLPCRQSFPCFCHLDSLNYKFPGCSAFWVPRLAPREAWAIRSGSIQSSELRSHWQVFTADTYLLILLAGPSIPFLETSWLTQPPWRL